MSFSCGFGYMKTDWSIGIRFVYGGDCVCVINYSKVFCLNVHVNDCSVFTSFFMAKR